MFMYAIADNFKNNGKIMIPDYIKGQQTTNCEHVTYYYEIFRFLYFIIIYQLFMPFDFEKKLALL